MRPTAPHGMAMAVGLGLFGVAGLLLLSVSGVAGLLADRQRADHLADTASLSAANWVAQSLNFQTYANRAIAANEIMMAQSLTLLSWVQYAEQTAQNFAVISAAFPGVGEAAAVLHEASAAASEWVELAARAEVPFRSGYTRALQGAQVAMHAAASPFATQTLLNEVIWSGDRRFFGQLLPTHDLTRYAQSVRAYAGPEREDFARHVEMSLDSFSRLRQFDALGVPFPPGCLPTQFRHLFMPLVRQGGTHLSDDYSNWSAIDTLSLHSWRRRSLFNSTCGSHQESVPIGWGAAVAAEGPGAALESEALYNPQAEQLALASRVEVPGYLGLAESRDLNVSAREERLDMAFRVPVLVRLPDRRSRAGWILRHEGPLDEAEGLGAAGWAVSVGRAEFAPSDSLAHGQSHLPSLFLPAWTARLDSATVVEEALALQLAASRSEP